MVRRKKDDNNKSLTSNNAVEGGDISGASVVKMQQVQGPAEMDWSYFSPTEVKVYGSFDQAFKLFRTLVQKEGIISDYKQKSRYEKPSEKKNRKHNETMQRLAEMKIKHEKMLSGELEKEKLKKEKKKEEKKLQREKKAQDILNSEYTYNR